LRFLDENQIARDTITLVFDKGPAALHNTLSLEESVLGWISALPWNHKIGHVLDHLTPK
jgi:hypothetical protein